MTTRIERVELVAVALDGLPTNDVGALSEVAAAACTRTAAHYKQAGFSPPWISYLATCDSEVVGICAFTSAHTAGRVEIAYNTFPLFEGRGVATAMVRELILRAGLADPSIELFAQTLAQTNASNAILRKLGFEFGGALEHPEEGVVWEWRRRPGI